MVLPVFSVLVEGFGGEKNWEGKYLKIYFLLVGRVQDLMLENNLCDGDQSMVLLKRRNSDRTVGVLENWKMMCDTDK